MAESQIAPTTGIPPAQQHKGLGYDGITADVPAGQAGLDSRPAFLYIEPTSLIQAQGITLEDGILQKEGGAAPINPTSIGTLVNPNVTTSAAAEIDLGAGAFKGSSFATDIGNVATKTGQFSVSHLATLNTNTAFTSSIAGGKSIFVSVAWCLTGLGVMWTNPTQLTDSRGNTYTLIGSKRISTGRNTQLDFFLAVNISAITNGDTLFFTAGLMGQTSGANVAMAAAASSFTGVLSPYATAFDTSATASGDAVTAVSVNMPTLAGAPEVVFAGIAASATVGNTAVTVTPGSGWANLGANVSIAGNGTYPPITVATMFQVFLTANAFFAIHDFIPYDSQTSPAGTVDGTVSVTAGTTNVVGSATHFTTALVPATVGGPFRVGDYIMVGTEIQQVTAINSATSLSIAPGVWRTSAAGSVYTLIVKQRLISATADGHLNRDDNNGSLQAETLATGLSVVDGTEKFVQGGAEQGATNPRKLFYVNGVDPIRVVLGNNATASVIAAPPADWTGTNQPVNAILHQNRLMAVAPFKQPHNLYVSSPSNHSDFTTTPVTMTIGSDVGVRIWGLAVYKGVLFTFKWPRGIHFLDDADPNVFNWSSRIVSEGLGVVPSPYSALQMDDDVLFMASDGTFHVLSAVDSFGGTLDSDISYQLGVSTFLRQSLNFPQLGTTLSVWYPHKKKAVFWVPTGTAIFPNCRLEFDFSGTKSNPPLPVKFTYSFRDTPASCGRRIGPDQIERPMMGEGGFIYILDQATRLKNGNPYTAVWQTPHLDMQKAYQIQHYFVADPHMGRKRKNWDFIELIKNPDTGSLQVDVFIDFQFYTTLLFDISKTVQRVRLGGQGRVISLRCTSADTGNPQMITHRIDFRLSGEDTRDI